MPGARIVVSGRAPLQMETRTSPVSADMPLDELDEDAAIACLAHDDVPAEVARFIHGHVGGNPLALRLAGDLARAESESAGGFREFISTEFASKLDDEVAQAILFRRFLGHIKSPDVRKLAHPGLTLRKITPELIKDVLAVPCGIDVPTLERANELWNELARETAVVIQDSAATLRHRPELRRQMIGLLRNSKPEQVRAIREAAIAYYQGNDHEGNTESRAERFYHMLCLDRPRTELDAAWEPGLEPYILSAREELSEEALIYLASRSEFVGFEAINTSESEWREQALVIWERKTAQWARELIRQDRHEDVDKALRLRTDRSPDSPLHLIHARVLKSLGRHEESLRALESALRDWPDEAGRTERIDLLLLQVRVLLNLDRRPEAAERLAETAPLVERSGTAEQHLEAASLAVRVASSSGEIVNAVARLAAVAGSWRDSQFRRVPELARKAAALMLRLSPSQAARIVRSVGLGPIDPEDQERLASAFTRWERASWQRSARKHMKPHGIAFLAGAEGDGRASGQSEGFWRRWFASTPPEELGGRLASMIELFPPKDRAREALRQTLLGRDDVAERRTGKARASEQGLSSADILSQAARLLAGAYDSKELERMLAFHLDIRLHDIVSPSLSFNQMIFEVLLWAERRGRLLDLMRAAAKVRPDRADLAEFLRVMGASLKA